jgi:hypothetical protein
VFYQPIEQQQHPMGPDFISSQIQSGGGNMPEAYHGVNQSAVMVGNSQPVDDVYTEHQNTTDNKAGVKALNIQRPSPQTGMKQ